MKCNRCAKLATLHITEIISGKVHELHLCEECAQAYLATTSSESAEGTGGLAKPNVELGEAELAELEKIVCPTCKQTYRDFRSTGRLGCAHCYSAFRSELAPLLENIHGELRHVGKFPKRAPDDSQKRYQLIKLRNDLRIAINEESYEEAARLRDEIQALEAGLARETPDV